MPLPSGPAGARAGLRILVVEDEVMISSMIEDMLSELGHRIVGFASSTEAARQAADADFDAALLDVNLPDGSIEPIAAALERRGKPFAFTTGLSDRAIPPAFKHRPVLRKPYRLGELDDVLARIDQRPQIPGRTEIRRSAPQ
jgi:DNA-binding response OmpR family regulator